MPTGICAEVCAVGDEVRQSEMAPLQNEADAVAFLNSLINYEKWTGSAGTRALRYDGDTFNRDAFRGMMSRLGNPQGRYAVIHVAGTKGKGSTCAMLETALRGAGLRTGLYTSPHLRSYCERIRVNGAMISGEDFARQLERLRGAEELRANNDVAAERRGFRTVFEYLTAAALVHFAECAVDVAVIETGLGGRLDSTNCFQGDADDSGSWPPLIDVITTIGLDHCEILGHDALSIAREKAAIAQRRAAAVVVGVQRPEFRADVWQAVRERAGALGVAAERGVGAAGLLDVEELCTAHAVEDTTADSPELARGMAEFHLPELARADAPQGSLARWLHGGVALRLPLQGAHQRDNLRTALVALVALEQAWRGRGEWSAVGAICGLVAAEWPGRMERVPAAGAAVYVDGAHCPLSAEALGRAVADAHPGVPVVALVGVMRDKNAAEIVRAFAAQVVVARWMCVAPPSPRGLPAGELGDIVRSVWPKAVVDVADSGVVNTDALAPQQDGLSGDVRRVISACADEARATGAVVVAFESLHLVDEFRAALREE